MTTGINASTNMQVSSNVQACKARNMITLTRTYANAGTSTIHRKSGVDIGCTHPCMLEHTSAHMDTPTHMYISAEARRAKQVGRTRCEAQNSREARNHQEHVRGKGSLC